MAAVSPELSSLKLVEKVRDPVVGNGGWSIEHFKWIKKIPKFKRNQPTNQPTKQTNKQKNKPENISSSLLKKQSTFSSRRHF